MKNVSDYGDEFIRRAKAGNKPRIRVSKKHAQALLGYLKREGFQFAKECFNEIHDPELRRIIETIFFSTVAGAAGGAIIGGMVGGPAGAQVGAVAGAATGFIAACVALTLTARQEDGPNGPELVLGLH